MENEEIEIIRQLKSGNEWAHRYLFEKNYVLLCKIAAECVKDDFIAETIVADVIVNFWEKRETIEITTSLRAYLVKSVRNRCLNYLQLKHVRNETRIAVQSNTNALIDYTSFADNFSPLAVLLDKELKSEFVCAVERLPNECKRVFRMSHFSQLKNQEIANQLNISINTVKYHLKIALKQLRNDLCKYKNFIVFWLF